MDEKEEVENVRRVRVVQVNVKKDKAIDRQSGKQTKDR